MNMYRTISVLTMSGAGLVSMYAPATLADPVASVYVIEGVQLAAVEGADIPPNYAEAYEWDGGVAPQGEADVMNRIGILYATGSGKPRDPVAALAWYRLAFENGSLAAAGNIGAVYFHGLAVRQSYVEAAPWLRLAADQGYAGAQNKLGLMYEGGLGVAQDVGAARELYERAAQQGYGPALVNLGAMYAQGSGVQVDDVRAYALVAAAIKIGMPGPARELAFYYLGALTTQLDTEQTNRAQELAQALATAGMQRRGASEQTYSGESPWTSRNGVKLQSQPGTE